jgi:hypothetical protein
MNDSHIQQTIEALIAEEHAIHSRPQHTVEDRKRVEDIEVQLDRAWDLLRQRRARREFGQAPDAAKARPAEVVERYRQ